MAAIAIVKANELDDYVSAEDPNYGWRHVEELKFKSLYGGTGYVLNVTSQKWLDKSLVWGPDGDLWTHQVVVIVPKNLKYTNVSHAYLTGYCGSFEERDRPVNPFTETDVLQIDELAHNARHPIILIKQIPNCPLYYTHDETQKGRAEDQILAWSWNEYLNDPKSDPKWLARFPMVKAGMQGMRAAQDFLS